MSVRVVPLTKRALVPLGHVFEESVNLRSVFGCSSIRPRDQNARLPLPCICLSRVLEVTMTPGDVTIGRRGYAWTLVRSRQPSFCR